LITTTVKVLSRSTHLGRTDSNRFVEKKLQPELLEAPSIPTGIALPSRHPII
jgi:hypothetical protein